MLTDPLVPREGYLAALRTALARAPVVALLGPRQCGKTTLARQLAAESGAAAFFDLEDSRDAARLTDPFLALEPLRGLVVLDEFQIRPDLLPVLRVLADRPHRPATFLVLGSASPQLIRGAAESLAGRVQFVDLTGFDLQEVGVPAARSLWLRGGFPPSFLAADEAASVAWREAFIRTFLTRDLPQLGANLPGPQMRRFWTMLAHCHGQVWNASELGRSLSLNYKTVQSYLDLLQGAMVVRVLLPWTANLGKRLRKAPKVYLSDSGLLHRLLGLDRWESLESHPLLGASWEGFAVEQILRLSGATEAYCWATHSGAELDLLLLHQGQRIGFEIKYTASPGLTRSMHAACAELDLARLYVVHAGDRSYPLNATTAAVAIGDLPALAAELRGTAGSP